MEKRFREYIRHFEKLDYDVLSEEEIQNERQGLTLEIGLLHQEMVRLMISAIGFLICACIFLSAALVNFNIFQFIGAAVTGIVAVIIALAYRSKKEVMGKLSAYADKLAQMQV